MNQILILTRNILAEQEIQQKLQSLNYEVYCSTKHFDSCTQSTQTLELFKFFQYVILSESVCESEVKLLVSLLDKYPLNIIRKVETKLTELDQIFLESEQIHAIISTDDSVDELRECLFSLKNKMEQREEPNQCDKVVQLSGKVSLIRSNTLNDIQNPAENHQFTEILHRLSAIESKVITILIKAGNQVVTREELCHLIWDEDVTNSHLASLSSTVTRIKNKFEHTNLEKSAIQTLWGKGYRLNQKLLERFENDEAFNRIVMNG